MGSPWRSPTLYRFCTEAIWRLSAPWNPIGRIFPSCWGRGCEAPAMCAKMRLTESDLKFVVETVATQRRDHDHIINLVRDKEDLLEPMLDDPKLAQRLVGNKEFSSGLALPDVRRAVAPRVPRPRRPVICVQRDARGKRIPVLEASQAVRLLGDPTMREYLTGMLCSFVRTNTGLLHWRERGAWRKRKFSDVDMDDMIALCHLVEPSFSRAFTNASLTSRCSSPVSTPITPRFLSGGPGAKPRARAPCPITSAKADASMRWPREKPNRRGRPLSSRCSRKNSPEREALNTLNDCYLEPLRARYFDHPAG